ncbi:hypothetical protein BDN67DRAFT_92907 [Paxillus ammoniavirescens]|nr:hypothetical protein BDN67DRAFT_92907 [Paxillus ammoniavirescens]
MFPRAQVRPFDDIRHLYRSGGMELACGGCTRRCNERNDTHGTPQSPVRRIYLMYQLVTPALTKFPLWFLSSLPKQLLASQCVCGAYKLGLFVTCHISISHVSTGTSVKEGDTKVFYVEAAA